MVIPKRLASAAARGELSTLLREFAKLEEPADSIGDRAVRHVLGVHEGGARDINETPGVLVRFAGGGIARIDHGHSIHVEVVTVGAGTDRTDGDFPQAWARMYGKGRVFVAAFGHDAATWEKPEIQTMWLEAIKWALGLTEADITPRPRPQRE